MVLQEGITKNMEKIGFIGQGYVGKGYADDFESRGYSVVRYALEEPYVNNKEQISTCDLVIVAVPTPTTPEGFDDSALRSALALVGFGKTALIKSTVVPGTTDTMQAVFPDKTILFSPEFLLEATAAADAASPIMNIIGITQDTPEVRARAEEVLALFPRSGHEQICLAREAEIIKYAHNIHGVFRILFANILYDLVAAHHGKWEEIEKALQADPYFSVLANYYNRPVHKTGRGAGGRCFVKDFAAFRAQYEKEAGDPFGAAMLRAMEQKNITLLKQSGKDLDILRAIYGDELSEG